MFGFWGAVLAVLGIGLLVPALRGWGRTVRLRRHGRAVTGVVTDVELHGYYSFRMTRPVVSYTLDGARHETTVGNVNGKAPLQTGMDLRVDPSDPGRAVAAYGSAAATLVLVYLVVSAVGLAICLTAVL